MISNDFVSTKLKIRDRQSKQDAVNLGSPSKDVRNNLTAVSNLTRPADAAQKTCCNSFYELSSQYSLPKLNKICDIVPTEIKCMRKCLEISEEKRKEFNLEVSDRIEEWIEHRLSFHEVICVKIQKELKLHAKQSVLTHFVPIDDQKPDDDNSSQRISKEEAFNLIKTISNNLGLNQLNSFENEFLSNDLKTNRFTVNKRGIEILKQIRMVSKLLSEENRQHVRGAKERSPKSSKLTKQQLSHLNQLDQVNRPAGQFVQPTGTIGHRPAQTNQPTGQQHQQQAGPQFGSAFRPNQPQTHYSLPPVNHRPSYEPNRLLRPPPPPPPSGRREVKNAYEDEIDPPNRQVREANRKQSAEQTVTTTVLPDLIDTQTEVSLTEAPQTASSLIEEIQTKIVLVEDTQTELPSNQLERREQKELHDLIDSGEAISSDPASPSSTEAVDDQTTTNEMPPDVTESYQCVQVKLNQSIIDHLKKLYPDITFLRVKDQPNESTESEREESTEDGGRKENAISTTAPTTDQKRTADDSNQLKARGIFSIFGSGPKEESEKPNPNPDQPEVVFNHMASKLIGQISSSESHEKINQLASEVLHNHSMPCQQQFLPNLADLLSVNLMLKHSTGVFKQERTAEVDKLCNQMLEFGGKLNSLIQNCAQSLQMEYMIKHTFNETEQGFKYCLRFEFKEKLANAGDRIDQSESVLVGHLEMNETEMNQLEVNQLEVNQLSQISRLSEPNISEPNISEVSYQLVDCLDWAKLKSCQTKFIPWLQLIEVIELKRLVDNKSMQFNELHLFKQNISALASSGLVSAANCKDLVLFENCAKQDLDGAINVDHRTGRLIVNHNSTCEVGTLRLNKLSLVTSLTNKITSQINEHMSPHCPKLNTILGLIGNSNKSETNIYQQNLISHYRKKYTGGLLSVRLFTC